MGLVCYPLTWRPSPRAESLDKPLVEFPSDTVYDKASVASVPETNSTRSAVSTQYRLVTDGGTDTVWRYAQ